MLSVASPRVLEVSPINSSSQSMAPHWELYITPLFFSFGSWSFGMTNTCLRVLLPFKYIWIPYLAHTLLMLSPRPRMYGMTMCPTLGLPLGGLSSLLLPELLFACVVLLPTWELLLPSTSQLLFVNLLCILVMAHLGYMHLTKASLRCSNSSLKSPCVGHAILALWVCVPMTLYLAERLLWLSHCKYWSVWVGFQYTVTLNKLSALGLTKVSRNGIAPFSWLPLTVNFIAGSILFMWYRNNCLWACCWMTKVLSTNLS